MGKNRENPYPNNNYKIIIVLIIISLAGIYLLGKGITGLVISESCCFGEDCIEENKCVVEMPSIIPGMEEYNNYNRTELIKNRNIIKNSNSIMIGSFVVIVYGPSFNKDPSEIYAKLASLYDRCRDYFFKKENGAIQCHFY